LMAHGLHTLSPQMGQAFDPNQHECLAHTEHASVPEGGIIETLRRGYRLYDKLLRPCSVLVSKGPAQTSDTPATAPSSAPGSTNS
jgi:molecular chaperone GrpE